MKNIVIGLDGLSASGKTTLANNLIRNDKIVFIELSDLYKLIVPYWITLKNKEIEEILKLLDDIVINYSINSKKVNFTIDKNDLKNLIKDIDYSRHDIYEMVQIESIKTKIYNYLSNIIEKLKDDYSVIVSGREISTIYPDLDYNFMLKADFDDRINRMVKRDKISKESAIKHIKIQNHITYIDHNSILLNSSRLNEKDIELMVKNVIKMQEIYTRKKKVIFFGAASTGKSTICKKCCETFDETYCGEYLRGFMENNNLSFSDLKNLDYASFNQIIENVFKFDRKLIDNSKKISFIDSGILHYALDFGIIESFNIQEMVAKEVEQAIIFVCDNDVYYEKDDLRPNNEELNLAQSQNIIIEYLKTKNIPFFILNGTIEERLNSVKAILKIT